MALNTPYKRINPNEFNYAAVGQKDPWFALGYALGEGYWNRYNQRGTEKSKASIMEGYDNWRKYGDVNRPAPKDLVDQAMTISVGGNKASAQDVEKASGSKSDKTIKPEVDHGLMKWDYVQGKYANSPNPVGDSISAQKLFSGTEIALNNTNMGAFDEEAFKLAIMDKLTKEGRSPQQREAAWAAIQPMIAQKKNEYNKTKSDELFKVAQDAFGNNDIAGAESAVLALNEVDPVRGKYAMSRLGSMIDMQNRKEMARFNAGVNGKDAGVFGSAEMQFIQNELNTLENMRLSGIKLDDNQIAYYDQLKARKADLLKPLWGSPVSAYDNFVTTADENLKSGKATEANIREFAEDYYKQGKLTKEDLDKVLAKYPDKPSGSKAKDKPKEPEKSQEEQWREFAAQGKAERASVKYGATNPWTGKREPIDKWLNQLVDYKNYEKYE